MIFSCDCLTVITKTETQGIPIKHDTNGYIAENETEMVAYTIELLNNKEKADIVGEKARELMKQNFSWDVISKKWKRLYQKQFLNKV